MLAQVHSKFYYIIILLWLPGTDRAQPSLWNQAVGWFPSWLSTNNPEPSEMRRQEAKSPPQAVHRETPTYAGKTGYTSEIEITGGHWSLSEHLGQMTTQVWIC